jgi:hypothetical protein
VPRTRPQRSRAARRSAASPSDGGASWKHPPATPRPPGATLGGAGQGRQAGATRRGLCPWIGFSSGGACAATRNRVGPVGPPTRPRRGPHGIRPYPPGRRWLSQRGLLYPRASAAHSTCRRSGGTEIYVTRRTSAGGTGPGAAPPPQARTRQPVVRDEPLV